MKRQHNKDNLIVKWVISEVGNWGGSMAEDANILKVIELLRDYK